MQYEFTSDWLTPKLGPWQEHVVPRLRDKPRARWIDVGSYEGRSALWIRDNALGLLSQIYCVDLFDDYIPGLEWWGRRGYPDRFDRNTGGLQATHEIIKLRGLSHEILAALNYVKFDGAYLDGGHLETTVYRDLALLWPKLVCGAVLVCDDYGCATQPGVRRAVDAFFAAHPGEHQIVHQDFQLIVVKLVGPPKLRELPVYTTNFFCSLDRENTWTRDVVPRLRDLAVARWLEVGSYEGQSARWTLDHVLCRPSDTITCVDVFRGDTRGFSSWGKNEHYEETFDLNVGAASNVVKVTGGSLAVMTQMRADGSTFHGIYLDGDHTGSVVRAEADLAWQMLLPGGVLIVDDYGSDTDLEVMPAVDEIVAGLGASCEILHRGHQAILLRRY